MSSSKKKAASSNSVDAQSTSTDENAVASEDGNAASSSLQLVSADDSAVPESPTASQQVNLQSSQPIPPPSEPRQFRAIGLVQGVYVPSEEQFNRGELVTREGLRLDAVLLGQVMSLVKKYLDLSLPHLWVVYPRTRDAEPMHVQLVGVWSPSGFGDDLNEDSDSEPEEETVLQASLSPLEGLKPPLKDGFFSIRGQVIQQNPDTQELMIKIQQTSRKKSKPAKAFKVKILGKIAQKPMGYFWDFEVVRDADVLRIEKATPIAFMPMKKKKRSGPPRRPIQSDSPQRPIKKSVPLGGDNTRSAAPSPSTPVKRNLPTPSRPLPKRIIRPQDND
ncbi:MAG: hypothetical protein AAGB01_07475 [Cyanobacteria bacterium P01_F01_bin.42]